MTSRPGDPPLFETEAVTPSAKKNLTAAKHKLLARSVTDNNLGAGSVYRVLIYSIEKANSYGAFWKKNSTIAREIGIDRSTVIEALNRLTLHGYIERIGRYNGIGNSSNVYVLALDLGGAVKAAIREARRRAKFPREQESNSTGNPPPRCSETPTPGVVIPRPQESSNRHTYTSLPMNPSLNSFSFASLADPESEKQVVQQGSDEGFEGVASIGENVASGTILPGKPSLHLHDTEDPSTSSPDEPLSSTLTVNRPIRAGEGPDHAQRSFGPMVVLTGGLETKEAADHGKASNARAPLLAAKKVVKDAIGQRKFVERDIELGHRLRCAAVPADARDGVRALEYIKWADELVETSAMSGGAA